MAKKIKIGRKDEKWLWWSGYIFKDKANTIPLEGVEVIENFEFKAVLEFKHFSRGCSSAKAVVEDQEGNTYEVFLGDYADMIELSCHGSIGGIFTFCKKGQNYGIKLAR